MSDPKKPIAATPFTATQFRALIRIVGATTLALANCKDDERAACRQRLTQGVHALSLAVQKRHSARLEAERAATLDRARQLLKMQRAKPYAAVEAREAMRAALRDLASLSRGGRDDWRGLAGAVAHNLRELAALLESARAGRVAGDLEFPDPRLALSAAGSD